MADPNQQPQEAPLQLDASGTLAHYGLTVSGVDEKSGLPLVNTPDGRTATFDLREHAKAQYGQTIPANAKINYNSPDAPVQVSPESLSMRTLLENFTDDKSKLKYLTNKYGEVLPTKDNGLVVNNNGVYQAYDPSFFNTYNPRELAEGFVEQLPKMVGSAAATAAIVALAGNPVGLTAIGGTGLAAGITSGTIRTSLGRLVGTYKADDEEQLKDIGMEGLANLVGSYFPLAAKNSWGIIAGATSKLKNVASYATQAMARSVFGHLTGTGESAMSTLIEDSPGVIKGIAKTFADAGEGATTADAVNLAKDRGGRAAKQFLQAGIEELPKQFRAGLEEAGNAAESGQFKSNVSNLMHRVQQGIDELNIGRFTDDVDPNSGKITSTFNPLSESEKTKLGVADPAPGAFEEVKRITNLINRYQNDGELEGKQAFNRLANLNKELNAMKYQVSDEASPSFKFAINKTIAAFKTELGQDFADQGLGPAWIEANKPYLKYSDSIDKARDILNSKDGIYTFADKITGLAGKQKSAYSVSGDIRELLGDAGEPLYNEILKQNAIAKFAPWQPKLGITNVASGSVALGHGNLPVAAAIATASSPRTVALGTAAATAPGRLADSIGDKVLPYAEKFQDLLRQMDPVERRAFLQNPNFLKDAYQSTLNAIQSVGPATQQLLQKADQHIQQSRGANGTNRQ